TKPSSGMGTRNGAISASTDIGRCGKKMWGNSPTSTVPHRQLASESAPATAPKYYPALGIESIARGNSEIGYHAPVRALRGPVAEECGPVVGGAPGRAGHPLEAEPARLAHQVMAQ